MQADFAIAIGTVIGAALLLHWKTHVKFIAIGGFIGLVLAELVALPLQTFLANRWEFWGSNTALSIVQLGLFIVPAIVLGLNHTVDKHRLGLGRTIATVVVTTLFILSNILAFLPPEWSSQVVERSIVGLQLQSLRVWIIVAMAVLIVVDSFHHKQVVKFGKK